MTERTGTPDFEAAFYQADAAVETASGEMRLSRQEVGNLVLTTGKIAACDACIPSTDVFAQTVPTGKYPVVLCLAEVSGLGQFVAAAMLRFGEEKPLVWDAANIAGRDQDRGDLFSHGADCAMGCFADLDAMHLLLGSEAACKQYSD